MSTKTLGQRIREAREAVRPKLSQGELGARVARLTGEAGYSASAVGQWEIDKHEPSVAALVAIATLTGADAAYLIIGKSASQLGSSGRLPRGGRVVPKITAVQAVAERADRGASSESVHTHFDCSDQAFAVPIADGRNATEYRPGDNVVIDPLTAPVPDDMVLARIDGAPIFGVYQRLRGGQIEIGALNKRWDPAELRPKRGDKIIGVMTEHARPRRQS